MPPSVAPLCTVTALLLIEPLTSKMPAATVVAPVKVLVPLRLTVPVPCFETVFAVGATTFVVKLRT